MRPELPFLAAAGVAVVGSTLTYRRPPSMTPAIFSVLALTIISSATTGTRLAPPMHALGMLTLLVTSIAATNLYLTQRKVARNG